MSILHALCHGPARPYELKFLTGLSDEAFLAEVNQLRWPQHLIDWDNRNVWSLTELGQDAIDLLVEHESARRRDAKCQGVSTNG